MNSSKTIKIILIFLVAACLAFVALKYLNGRNKEQGGVLGKATYNDPGIGKDIITELNRLNSIDLDGEIFKSKAFLSLQDFALEVTPEKQGRSNPFAPFGAGRAVSSEATTSQAR